MFFFVLAITLSDLQNELESSDSAFEAYLNGTYSLSYPYRIKYIDLSTIFLKIRINPCNGMANEFCCEGMGEGMCQDNPVSYSGPNLDIAWSCNNIVVICANDFYQTPECGTYIEVHYPNSTNIISEIQVNTFNQSGFHMESVYTRQLIPGKYELWWVQRDRTGRWIFYIKQFYIAY